MRENLKAISVASLIGIFVLIGKTIDLMIWDRFARARLKAHFLKLTSQGALWILGISVKHDQNTDKGAQLIVCNHLSYVDILIISSRYPAIFVTSEEVNEDPLLGMITRAAGCLFVERRHPFRLPQEIAEIESHLARGISVMFFPEGTTTDGTKIMKFKSSLFQSAKRLPQVKVLPLCLAYTHADGVPLDENAANKIFYYGEMTFAEQLKKLLSLKTIETTIDRLPETAVEDRKLVAHSAYRMISERYFAYNSCPHPG